MKVVEQIIKLIKITDLFTSSNLLRHKRDTNYTTITGGLVSLIIIVTITIAFSSMIIQTIKKIKIDCTLDILLQQIPSPINLIAGSDDNFMMAVNVKGYNLSAPARYFDIYAQNRYWDDFVLVKNQKIKLQPCTQKHWYPVKNQIWTQTEKAQLGYDPRHYLCLPLNFKFQFSGVYGSKRFSFLGFFIQPCSNKTDAFFGSKCVYNETQMKSKIYPQVYLKYIDSVINPNQRNSLKYFLSISPMTHLSFGSQNLMSFTLSDYQINTDTQILPFKQIETQKGGKFQQSILITTHPQPSNNFFNRFYISRSQRTYLYNRQVQKLSTVLSYIGGLVGAILTFLFFINNYTNFAMQVSISSSIFYQDNQRNQNSHIQSNKKSENQKIQQTNLFQFFRFKIYKFSRQYLNYTFQWPKYQKMQEYIDQIQSQLDITKLLKRIIALQYCFNHIFDQKQKQMINKYQPVTPKSIKNNRRKFFNFIQSQCKQSQMKSENLKIQNISNKFQDYGEQVINIDSSINYQNQKIHKKIKFKQESNIQINNQNKLSQIGRQTNNDGQNSIIINKNKSKRNKILKNKESNILKIQQQNNTQNYNQYIQNQSGFEFKYQKK